MLTDMKMTYYLHWGNSATNICKEKKKKEESSFENVLTSKCFWVEVVCASPCLIAGTEQFSVN